MRISKLAAECRARKRFATEQLDKEAAIKRHLTFEKELLKRATVGDLESRDDLRAAIIAEVGECPGLECFFFVGR